MKNLPLWGSVLCFFLVGASQAEKIKPEDTEVWKPVPKQVNPYPVPSDAKVLFDGKDLTQWQDNKGNAAAWAIKNGEFSHKGKQKFLLTKEKFCDMQLHVEWKSPAVDESRTGQRRGNSGIKIQNKYEVQILDSYNNPTYVNGQAASIYKQSAPLVNATLPPQQWQTYDIIYKSPTFDGQGKLINKGYMTVLHNGVLVQNHFALQGSTAFKGQPKYTPHGCEPIGIQYHGSKVAFRNIWVRELYTRST